MDWQYTPPSMRSFDSLSESELLALAIWQEEEDGRIYEHLADQLKDKSPSSAQVFERMRQEEISHHQRLTDLFHQKFGPHIPLIRRQNVKGFVRRKPVWLSSPLGVNQVRKQMESMEAETQRFYLKASQRAADPAVKKLLEDLAGEEGYHVSLADRLEKAQQASPAKAEEEKAQRRLFLLQVVQPGLAGLMDGSVSTLAPLFAAAFATHATGPTFKVGLAASVGAGISMGFAEALSDDGSLTGRGQPLLRGTVCGLMTTCGGIGHTLPYLIPYFHTATALAAAVVIVELAIISWIRNRYMDTPLMSAAFQVMVGGALVFLAGILIGES
jgi:erythrin-vacuolar iron transport family protein